MNSTHKRGAGPRLNDEQRLQILELVEQPSAPSLRNIGRKFGVSESAIRSLIKKKDEIRMRTQLKDQNARKTTFRGSKGKYPELEESLYAWIDASRQLSIALPPSVIMEKARRLATQMNICDDDFKATWGWFRKFRHRQCLNTISLYGEGEAVDRDENMECVNVDANESEKLNQNLLEEIDEVIAQASKTSEPLAYDKNDSHSEFVEMQDMHGCLKEEDLIVPKLLQHIVDSELMLNSIMTTTYLSSEKAKQVKSALLSARRIIEEANSAIVSKRIAKSRQMTLHDVGIK